MYVSVRIEARIAAYQVDDALEAINALHRDKSLMSSGSPDDPHFAWVDNPPAGGFPTLRTALQAWRYGIETDSDGSIEIVEFTGEKMGDDELLFRTLAPFIDDGDVVEFCATYGEDYGLRLVFDNGRVIRLVRHYMWIQDQSEDT